MKVKSRVVTEYLRTNLNWIWHNPLNVTSEIWMHAVTLFCALILFCYVLICHTCAYQTIKLFSFISSTTSVLWEFWSMAGKDGGDEVVKQGLMVKRSQNKKRFTPVNYKQRWFVLTQSYLIYYDTDGEVCLWANAHLYTCYLICLLLLM